MDVPAFPAFKVLRDHFAPTSLRAPAILKWWVTMRRPETAKNWSFRSFVHNLRSARHADRKRLAKRIQAYYQRTCHDGSSTDSFWAQIDDGPRGDAHRVLLSGTTAEVAALLANPAGNSLFYGFESLYAEQNQRLRSDPKYRAADIQQTSDHLLTLASALGAPASDVPAAVEAVAGAFGAPLAFPNPYPNEIGVESPRGIISYRPLQAIYQAKRLQHHGAASALEIGAGLGRTAYYAHQLGITDYTIVDLPLTNVAQAYFLAVTLGEDVVRLHGEPGFERRGGVRIAPPSWLAASTDHFDVVLNADSMTEMSIGTARDYLDQISGRCRVFLSMNQSIDHAINPFSMAQLFAERDWRADSSPYPMRPGYFEEVVDLSAVAPVAAPDLRAVEA